MTHETMAAAQQTHTDPTSAEVITAPLHVSGPARTSGLQRNDHKSRLSLVEFMLFNVHVLQHFKLEIATQLEPRLTGNT